MRDESNEFHIFSKFILQQIIVSKLTVHVHPQPYSEARGQAIGRFLIKNKVTFWFS